MADVFDEQEYADRRKALKDRHTRLTAELHRLKPTQLTREQFEARKTELVTAAELHSRLAEAIDFPFKQKRDFLKQYVDRIVVDVRGKTFTIEGKLSVFPITTTFVCESKPALRVRSAA